MTDKWHNLYDDSWKDLIVPEAFAHPAKMAYGLTRRIFKHALAEGWIKAGDVVVDPFGGIGSTGIVGSHFGLQVVCVELERKFVDMATGYDCDGKVTLTTIKTKPETTIIPAEPGGWYVRLRALAAYWAADGEIDYGGDTAFLKLGFESEQDANNFADELPDSFEGRWPRDYYTVMYREPVEEKTIHTEAQTKIVCKKKSRCGKDFPHAPHHVTGNFELHRKSIEAFTHFGKPLYPVIIQGDSRKLSEIIGSCDLLVSSPPYIECPIPEATTKRYGDNPDKTLTEQRNIGYGQTPGQLGAMKPGSIDAVISRPPYAEMNKGDNSEKQTKEESVEWRRTPGGSMGQSMRRYGYGSTPGNLGNLKPGNPEQIINHKSQIVNQVDAIISSPPYEGSQTTDERSKKQSQKGYWEKSTNKKLTGAYSEQDGQKTDGNIACEQGETFWQAARQIVSECCKILKPGGHAIWVVKAFVRNKKIVDFPGDWRRLCESLGFETVHEHHAMLVKETRKKSLFGHEIIQKTERKSFFRRLAEQKGSPKIDYEVVLCMKKSG